MYMEEEMRAAGYIRAALCIGERDASPFLAHLAILYPLPKVVILNK